MGAVKEGKKMHFTTTTRIRPAFDSDFNCFAMKLNLFIFKCIWSCHRNTGGRSLKQLLISSAIKN